MGLSGSTDSVWSVHAADRTEYADRAAGGVSGRDWSGHHRLAGVLLLEECLARIILFSPRRQDAKKLLLNGLMKNYVLEKIIKYLFLIFSLRLSAIAREIYE